MDSARGSHFNQWTMTIVFSTDNHTIRFGFKQVFVSMKIMRLVLSSNRLTSHRIIICHAEQFHAFHAPQVRDVGLAMMMGKRKNTNLYHYASARGCNFIGWPVWAD